MQPAVPSRDAEGGEKMIYIENIYICLSAPLLIAVLYLKHEWRKSLFFLLTGMTCSLLSAYISTFFAAVMQVDASVASHAIAPAVEEIIKFLPVILYIMLFEPPKREAINAILLIAVGFATFENVCFLTSFGTSELMNLLIRGFGTGTMHIVCGMMLSVGMFFLWDRIWLRAAGVFAVLCVSVTFHAIFNIFVSHPGISLWIGSSIPLVIAGFNLFYIRNKFDASEYKT